MACVTDDRCDLFMSEIMLYLHRIVELHVNKSSQLEADKNVYS
jgi:hypothetical protein